MTRQECEDKIQRMLLVKAGAVKPELPDYNDMRRYQVLEINLNDGTTVKRLVKTGTNLKIVGKEDLFEELYEIHLSTGHSGRDNMKKEIKQKFANLTQDVLMAFLKTCEFCSTKQSKAPKGIVVKPILSKEAFSRFQVGYIDLQSCPDETEYGTFKFILHGQDHLTKFTFLEVTENKSGQSKESLTSLVHLQSFTPIMDESSATRYHHHLHHQRQQHSSQPGHCHVPRKVWHQDDQR